MLGRRDTSQLHVASARAGRQIFIRVRRIRMAHLRQQFKDALSWIEPGSDKINAPSAHQQVRDVLEADPRLAEYGINPVLIGSYKRNVSIRHQGRRCLRPASQPPAGCYLTGDPRPFLQSPARSARHRRGWPATYKAAGPGPAGELPRIRSLCRCCSRTERRF